MNRIKRLAPFFNADGVGGGNDPAPKDDDKTIPYERFKAVNDEKKALGDQLKAFSAFGSVEDLSAKIAKLTELETAAAEAEKAKLSEIERANKEREEALKKAQELEGKLAETQKTHRQSVITAEFRMLAKEAGAQNVASALKLADLAGVEIGEDGAVKGVAEAIEALKASDPYLFAKSAEPKPIGGGGIPPKQDEVKTLEAQLAEAKKAGDFAKVIELSNKLRK